MLLSLEQPVALVDEKGKWLKGHSLPMGQQKTITFATLILFPCYKWKEEMLPFWLTLKWVMVLWFATLLDAIVIAAAHSVVHGNICPAVGIELLINWFIFPLSILSFHYDGNVRGSSDQLECLQLLFQITACSSINELCFCYNITRIVLKIHKLKMQKLSCFSFFILDVVIKSYRVTCYR